MKKKVKQITFILLVFLLGVFSFANAKTETPYPILRIGYFYGGRTMLLYRALIHDYFDTEKINAIFYTKKLHSTIWKTFDRKSGESAMAMHLSGKAKGTDLNEIMYSGKTDMAFIGEAAFIRACALGEPIMAIAQLGADDPKM